jgi:hypothetical protein
MGRGCEDEAPAGYFIFNYYSLSKNLTKCPPMGLRHMYIHTYRETDQTLFDANPFYPYNTAIYYRVGSNCLYPSSVRSRVKLISQHLEAKRLVSDPYCLVLRVAVVRNPSPRDCFVSWSRCPE